MSIWTDDVLDKLANDAGQQANQDVPCLFSRRYLATTVGKSVYTLPNIIKSIRRITWRGREIYEGSWEEFEVLTPATVVVSPTDKVEGVVGRPMWYCLHPTDIHDIRFYPTPDEAFVDTGDPYSPTPNEARCCITFDANYDSTDPLLSLPDYVARRTIKAYVLWKAFEKEGKGQDLKASQFYQQKYNFLISKFGAINSGCFVSKKYMLEDGSGLSVNNTRYPRPMLPPNFERVIY